MARTARLVVPGAWYHVTARGIERRSIFANDADRRHFLELLAELTERFRLRLHAYVLMDNHYHLLVQLPEPNLSRAIQWLNLSHTSWFNRRHQRVGYLFQGRFKSVIVDPAAWAVSLSIYIHLNPVRLARLGLSKCQLKAARDARITDPGPELIRQRLAALRSHHWSSFHAYTNPRRCPPWLDIESILELCGGPAAERHAKYRRHIQDQLRQGRQTAPWENLHENVILGARGFIANLRETIEASLRLANRSSGRPPRWAQEPVTFQQVIAAVEKTRGERWLDFRDRHGDVGRDLSLTMARHATTLTLAQLARECSMDGPAQVAMSIKRFQARLAQNPTHRRAYNAVARALSLKNERNKC